MNKNIIKRMPTKYELEELDNEKDLLLFCSKLCACFIVMGAGLLMVG